MLVILNDSSNDSRRENLLRSKLLTQGYRAFLTQATKKAPFFSFLLLKRIYIIRTYVDFACKCQATKGTLSSSKTLGHALWFNAPQLE